LTWYGTSETTICWRSLLFGMFSISVRARSVMEPRPVV